MSIVPALLPGLLTSFGVSFIEHSAPTPWGTCGHLHAYRAKAGDDNLALIFAIYSPNNEAWGVPTLAFRIRTAFPGPLGGSRGARCLSGAKTLKNLYLCGPRCKHQKKTNVFAVPSENNKRKTMLFFGAGCKNLRKTLFFCGAWCKSLRKTCFCSARCKNLSKTCVFAVRSATS